MGFSINEFIIIVIILLIFIKTDDLPRICYYIGKLLRQVKILQIRAGDIFSFYENSHIDKFNHKK